MQTISKYILAFLLLSTFVATSSFSQLLIAAKEKGKKYGYINEYGVYEIKPQYDEAFAFSEGYAVVKTNKKYGVINTKNEFVIPADYDNVVGDVNQGKITLYKGNLAGVIDVLSGKLIIPHKYLLLSAFNDGYVVAYNQCVEIKGQSQLCQFSILDISGKEILNSKENNFLLKYDDIRTYNKVRKGLLLVRNPEYEVGHQQKFLDVTKNEFVEFAVPFNSKQMLSFAPEDEITENSILRSNLMAIKLSNDTIAYYNATEKSGEFLKIKFRINATKGYPFFNGVAVVIRNGFLSFIDENGKTICDTKLNSDNFGAAPPMHFNGLASLWKKAGKENKGGYVDMQGSIKIPFQYEDIHPFEYDVTPVKYKGKYGLIRKDGSWAVEPKFDELNIGDCPCYR